MLLPIKLFNFFLLAPTFGALSYDRILEKIIQNNLFYIYRVLQLLIIR